jgi:hypothetical protein
MDYKIHGYFIGEAELNDEPDFRCECCGSNKIWTRRWQDYVFRSRWDLRYECQGCGAFWWAELEHTNWVGQEAWNRLIAGKPDPLDPERKMG